MNARRTSRFAACAALLLLAAGSGQPHTSIAAAAPAPFLGVGVASHGARAITFESNGGGSGLGIYTMGVDGSHPHLLPFGLGNGPHAWSPDGKLIAYQSTTTPGPITIAGPNGDHSRTLNVSSYGDLAWSPDGKRLAFITFPDDAAIVNVDGTGFKDLVGQATQPPPCWDDISGVTWASNDELVFSNSHVNDDTCDSKQTGIFRVSTSGGSPAQLASGKPADTAFRLVMSPDRTHLAFDASDAGGSWEQVYVASAGGGGAKPVSPDGAFYEEPAWSPDSRAVVYADTTTGAIDESPAGGGSVIDLTKGFSSWSNGSPEFEPACSRVAGAASHPARSALELTCPLSVDIQVSPGIVKSGQSRFAPPDTGIGFIHENESQGSFRDTCASGCTDVLVTVRDDLGQPVADAQVTADVSAPALRSGKLVAASQGQGYLCQAPAQDEQGWDQKCGHIAGLKTDGKGQLHLRYWAPSVWAPVDASSGDLPAARIYVTANDCSSACGATGKATQDVTIAPHLEYSVPDHYLANSDRTELIAWDRNELRVTRGSAIESFLVGLSRVSEWAPLAKLAHKIPAAGIPLQGDAADLVWLAWFAKTYHLTDTGLINLNAKDFANYIVSYVDTPAANLAWGWFKQHVWQARTYTEAALALLKDYAQKLWFEDHSPTLLRHTTLDVYEGSNCGVLPGDFACRGVAGVQDNLYLAFSARDNPDYFFPAAITAGYAAPTWLPAQCTGAGGCKDS